MAKVYIAYAEADRPLAPFVAELLRFHGLDAKWDEGQTRDRDIPHVVLRELLSSDAMVVIVSREAENSGWVAREIAAFHVSHENALIIPLEMKDRLDLTRLMPGNYMRNAIRFADNYFEGFVALLQKFGQDFLPEAQRPPMVDERRAGEDRRKSSVVQRLRVGFVLGLSKHSKRGMFQLFEGAEAYSELKSALLEEATKYKYSTKDGAPCYPETALNDAIDRTRAGLANKPDMKAVGVVEAVADMLDAIYSVEATDRRNM